MLALRDIDFDKKGVTITSVLNEKFIYEQFKILQNDLDNDVINAIELSDYNINNYMKDIMLSDISMKELRLELEEILEDKDKGALQVLFLLSSDEAAKEVLNNIKDEVEPYYDNVNELIDLDLVSETKINIYEKLKESYLDYFDIDFHTIMDGLDDFYDGTNNETIISYNGLPYSYALQRNLVMDDLTSYISSELINEYNGYFLFSDTNKGYATGHDYFGKYAVASYEGVKVFESFSDAASTYGYFEDFEYVTGTKLDKGNADRTAITEVIRDYNNEESPMFVRYLVSDGKCAYLICSNYSSYRLVDQYILIKTNGAWQIQKYYLGTYDVKDLVMHDVPEFNPMLLPNFTPSDYTVDYMNSYHVENITEYLIQEEYLVGKPDVEYISAIDSYIYALYKDGQRFFIVKDFQDSNKITSVFVIEGINSDYHYLLDTYTYTDSKPYHVFLQD